MNPIKKVWNWLIVSSANPNELALTIKGFLIGVLPILIIVLHKFGLDNPQLGSLPDQAQSFIVFVLGILSSVITAYGLGRKILLTLTNK